MTDAGTVEDLVESRSGMADSLEAILEVDAERDGWTFDDVPVDTGTFGTLVSTGVVEERPGGDGYRVADREAVERALDGTSGSEAGTGTRTNGGPSVPTVDGLGDVRSGLDGVSFDALRETDGRWLDAGAIAGIVALFVATRAHIYGSVFRNGDVVLTVNDPYFYRTLVDRALAVAPTPLDLGVLADLPSSGEPLYVATMWLLAASLGGGPDAAGAVLAWYPVVATAITGALVYLLGSRVIGDRRVGFVAGVALALTPGYATRSGLGFADHHPFDYLWLTATIVAFAWLVSRAPARGDRRAREREGNGERTADPGPGSGSAWRSSLGLGRSERRGAAVLGVAVAGQTLSWGNSPILLFPIALYLAAKAPIDVSLGRSPVDANAPVLAALGVATVLTVPVHLLLGWLPAAAAFAPFALLVGGVGVVAAAELLSRRGYGVRSVIGVEIGAAVLSLAVLVGVVPSVAATLFESLGRLFLTDAISEAESLFSPGSYGGLEWFGLFLPLAIPFLFWGVWRSIQGSGVWLVMSAYAWYLLVLSAVQLRFMGELAPVLSVFTGVGFVWALGALGVWAPPAPFRDGPGSESESGSGSSSGSGSTPADAPALTPRTALIAALCLLLVASPAAASVGPKVGITAHDGESYETAMWMHSYADERGWEFPENKVFSRRDANRMYNYFVGGNGRSYGYANQNYPEFVFGADPDEWYPRLRGEVGFVVIEPLPRREGTTQELLYTTYGSQFREHDAVSHYRAVYASESTTHKVFVLVPGAKLRGAAPPNATVEVRTDVDIPNEPFPYRKEVTGGPNGDYTAVVPYPGEYEVQTGNRTREVTVPERAVREGMNVSVAG